MIQSRIRKQTCYFGNINSTRRNSIRLKIFWEHQRQEKYCKTPKILFLWFKLQYMLSKHASDTNVYRAWKLGVLGLFSQQLRVYPVFSLLELFRHDSVEQMLAMLMEGKNCLCWIENERFMPKVKNTFYSGPSVIISWKRKLSLYVRLAVHSSSVTLVCYRTLGVFPSFLCENLIRKRKPTPDSWSPSKTTYAIDINRQNVFICSNFELGAP